jgi:hypothetical protein
MLEWVSDADPDYLSRRIALWRAKGYEPVQVTLESFNAQIATASVCQHGARA